MPAFDMTRLTELSGQLSSLLWGSRITLGLLLGVGVYLTVRLGFIQITMLRYALRELAHKPTGNEPGEVSGFRALATALSGTVGTGNIAGVATAITFGGPGALFWMWVTAIFGMATKFAESTLALNYREIDADGEAAGGPMYTLKNGLKLPWLGGLYAFFVVVASFGIGNMVQSNSVVDGVAFAFPTIGAHKLALGCLMAVLVGAVIIGGVRRIASVAGVLVPVMSLIYMGAGLLVLALNFSALPGAVVSVVQHALAPEAVGGAALGEAIRWGVARGLFSNEAGLGSASMAFSAMKVRHPAQGGLVNMFGPLFDTLVVCSVTGLAIVVTGAAESAPAEAQGAALTAFAFAEALGPTGHQIVAIGLALFAFSTMVSWSYYGDRCACYLFGARAVLPYRLLFVLMIVAGATVQLKLVWNISDVMNILMAAPNLIALVGLCGVVVRLKRDYLAQKLAGAL